MTAPEPTIQKHRRTASLAWIAIACCVLISVLARQPLLGTVSWLGALAAMVPMLRLHGAMQPQEQLVRPRMFYATAGAVLGVSIAGCVMGMLPAASERSQLLALFFGITAILAYRTLVARGPRPVVWLVGLTSLTWLPAMIVLVIRCKCGRHDANWTEDATRSLFVSLLVLLGVVMAVTLRSFQRRTDDLPDARARFS